MTRIYEMKELYKMIKKMEKIEKKPVQDSNTFYNPNLDDFIKILFELGWLVKKNNKDVEKMPHLRRGKRSSNIKMRCKND